MPSKKKKGGCWNCGAIEGVVCLERLHFQMEGIDLHRVGCDFWKSKKKNSKNQKPK